MLVGDLIYVWRQIQKLGNGAGVSSMESGEERAWEELSQMDQADVCRRSLATFDQSMNSYRLRVIDEEYAVRLPSRRVGKIFRDGSEADVDWMARLLILLYLVNAKDIPLAGKLRSPYEFKGGELFFSAPSHVISFEPMLQRFRSPQEFLEAGLFLGGRRVPYADEAFELPVLPRVPVTYLLWAGDEEFAPRISVLFDATAEQQLPIDALWLVILVANRRLLQ